MIHLLETLKAFGGWSTSTDIYEWFSDQGIARQADLANLQQSGETRFAKEVRFARQLLFYGGLIANDANGSWRLTPLGWEAELDVESARALARRSNWKVRPGTEQAIPAWLERVRPKAPSRGPMPQSWTGQTIRDASGPASTYAMRFGDSNVWKIGFTSNVTSRLADLNRHIPVEILGCRWALVFERHWVDAIAAFRMEQALLTALADHRTTGERVSCAEQILKRAWLSISMATAD